jgi:hypothetical protein
VIWREQGQKTRAMTVRMIATWACDALDSSIKASYPAGPDKTQTAPVVIPLAFYTRKRPYAMVAHFRPKAS